MFRFTPEMGLRLRGGMTQQELAVLMGRQGKGNHQLIGKVELGKAPYPSLGFVADYLRACKASFNDITDLLNAYTSQPTVGTSSSPSCRKRIIQNPETREKNPELTRPGTGNRRLGADVNRRFRNRVIQNSGSRVDEKLEARSPDDDSSLKVPMTTGLIRYWPRRPCRTVRTSIVIGLRSPCPTVRGRLSRIVEVGF